MTTQPGRRRTIRDAVELDGIGLHTGARVHLRLEPGAPGTGLRFRRTDLPNTAPIPARLAQVTGSERHTVLGEPGASVATVEHLLAAVSSHAIDDLEMAVTGPEVPIRDGSARDFFEALAGAGFRWQSGNPERIRVRQPLHLTVGTAEYMVVPAGEAGFTVTVHWDHPLVRTQTFTFRPGAESFGREVAPARTFGFLHEAEALRTRGLARGADPSCVIILDAHGVVDGTLRWPNEFVRHKLLDLLGDLALLGGRLPAQVTARYPSHRGNVMLARAIEQHAREGKQADGDPGHPEGDTSPVSHAVGGSDPRGRSR